MALPEASPVWLDDVPAARTEWLALTRLLDRLPPVPCRVGGAEAWWPAGREVRSAATRMALAGCAVCQARAACLAYALAAGERHGVWGGTTPDQRRELRWAVRDNWVVDPPVEASSS